MKRILNGLIVLTIILSLTACSNDTKSVSSTTIPASTVTSSLDTTIDSTISLNIIIKNIDEDKILFEGPVEITQPVETLADFLENQDAFNVETVEGDYGLMITSLCDVAQNSDNGPWWTYSSDNNQQCITAGYCDGVSALKIADGDNFEFDLTSTFN